LLRFRTLIHTNVKNGITGNIEFNEKGDRIESLYEIINIQYGQSKVVGTYRSNTVSLKGAY
jgi:ABC-type branched-subunit amino acid transport system substrate-binding protein